LPKQLLCPEHDELEHDELERNNKPTTLLPAPAHGESWAQARQKALKLGAEEDGKKEDDEDDEGENAEDEENKTKRKKRTTTSTTRTTSTTTSTTTSRSPRKKKLKPSIPVATKAEIDITQAICRLCIADNAPLVLCLRKLGARSDSIGANMADLMDKLEAINNIVNPRQSNDRTNDFGSADNGGMDDGEYDGGGDGEGGGVDSGGEDDVRTLFQTVPNTDSIGEDFARYMTKEHGQGADEESCPDFPETDSPKYPSVIDGEAVDAGSNYQEGDDEGSESREESIHMPSQDRDDTTQGTISPDPEFREFTMKIGGDFDWTWERER
jgi:hypothetical protein